MVYKLEVGMKQTHTHTHIKYKGNDRCISMHLFIHVYAICISTYLFMYQNISICFHRIMRMYIDANMFKEFKGYVYTHDGT